MTFVRNNKRHRYLVGILFCVSSACSTHSGPLPVADATSDGRVATPDGAGADINLECVASSDWCFENAAGLCCIPGLKPQCCKLAHPTIAYGCHRVTGVCKEMCNDCLPSDWVFATPPDAGLSLIDISADGQEPTDTGPSQVDASTNGQGPHDTGLAE